MRFTRENNTLYCEKWIEISIPHYPKDERMSRIATCFLICFIVIFKLFAEEELPPDEPFVSSLVKTQSLLSTTVNSVSVISGEWLNSEMDFAVIGPEPLILSRGYSSNRTYSKKLGFNWDFNRPHSLMIEEEGHDRPLFKARYTQPSGIVSIHESDPINSDEADQSIPLILSRTQGLTNCRLGEISARTNLHNTIIEFDRSKAHCAALSGNGSVTYFKYSHQTEARPISTGKGIDLDDSIHYHYKPDFERKANGNYLIFREDGIYTVNPSQTECYGWVKFHSLGKDALEVTASDGKTAVYQFSYYEDGRITLEFEDEVHPPKKDKECKTKRYTLSEVSYSHKPHVRYEYTREAPRSPSHHPGNPLLKCKQHPQGRFQAATYYRSGENKVDGIGNVYVENEDDFRYHRIKELKSPVGENQTPIVTHRFIYEADELAEKNEPFSGRTEVYDAYLHKTVYTYNDEHRPTSLQRYDQNQQLYSSDHYVWDDQFVFPNDCFWLDYIRNHLKKFIPTPKPPKNPSQSRTHGKDRSEEAAKRAKKHRNHQHEDESDEDESDDGESFNEEPDSLNQEEERRRLPITRGHSKPPSYIQKHFPEAPSTPDPEENPPVTRGQGPEVMTREDVKKLQEKKEEREEKRDEQREKIDDGKHSNEHLFLPIARGFAPYPAKIRKLIGDKIEEKLLLPAQLSIEDLIKRCLKSKILHKEGKGNLRGRYLEDQNGDILYAQFFDYDKKGNIIQESCYGNLTGTNSQPIHLGLHEVPRENGVECYRKQFIYSQDEFNLLLEEWEENGKGIRTVYIPETDLVASKFVTESGTIRFRQFHQYDENGTLIKAIKDNGVSQEESDLAGVTERLITTFVPRKAIPMGLPECIEERYWDPATGQEIMLKRVTCQYSQDGRLTHQDHFDAMGNYRYTISWEYDPHGNVITETNALGQVIRKEYDENDNLIFEQGIGLNKKYEYDFSNRLIRTEEIHPDGKSFVTAHRYDYLGNRLATIDRYGQETRFIYDEFNRLIRTEYPAVLNDQRCMEIPTSETQYDAADRPVLKIDACGRQTQIRYNARGTPIEIVHPDDTVEKFEYNLEGTLAKSIAPNGTQTVYLRDCFGRVFSEEAFDGQGQLLTSQTWTYQGNKVIAKTDAEGCTTYYLYDGAGRLISERRGEAFKTLEYDSLGRVAKVIQWTGDASQEKIIQASNYDLLNRVLEERLEDAEGRVLQRTRYAYDEQGHLTHTWQETEVGESLTVVEYNADGQPIKLVNPEGQTTHIVYDDSAHDRLGLHVLQVITTDAQGRNIRKVYDALGRVCEITQKDAMGKLLAMQEIRYDSLGRRTKTIDIGIADGTLKGGSTNAWSYHLNGQVASITEAVGTPEQKTTYFFYNAYSQKEKILKPDGVEIIHTYDAFGRLSSVTSNDGSIADVYTYNRCHQVIQVKDLKNQTATTCLYDSAGQLIQENLGNGLSLGYRYDRLGRPVELHLPNGSSVQYHYQASHLKEVHRYEKGQVCYTHKYDRYDLSGALLQSTLIGHAGEVRHHYDRAGRPTQVQHPAWSQSIPQEGYDSLGRLVAMTTQDIAGVNLMTYGYDDLDHLQSEQGSFTNRYQTDSIHNRLKKNELDYQVNALNQVEKQGNCLYRYDRNGNLIQKTDKGKITHYVYDALNRLVSVSSKEGTTKYRYDAFNRRLDKVQQGKTSRFIYQGQNEIGCVDETGQIQELRILGSGIDAEIGAAIAIELHGKTYAPLHDGQGHLVCLIDPQTGQAVESYRYSAFGEEIILNSEGQKVAVSQVDNPWRFACKRVDAETGWIYFGRRYYDPEMGRWTTPDPLFFADGPNLYAYLHHSPLMSYDAYGLYGEAYRDSVNAGANAGYYTGSTNEFTPQFPIGPDSNRDQPLEYYKPQGFWDRTFSNCYYATAGCAHGCMDFCTSMVTDFASFANFIGVSELDDPLVERLAAQAAYFQWQSGQLDALNQWIIGCVCDDPNNSIYHSFRYGTSVGLEVASIVTAGYGVAKVSVKAGAALARVSLQESRLAGQIIGKELKYVLSSGAENANAAVNLTKKLSQLEDAQLSSAHIRHLTDGRIRYYDAERMSRTIGPTRGSAFVTEYNPATGKVRGWNECYDHFGKINRVHPKDLNGQRLLSPHYPPIASELR